VRRGGAATAPPRTPAGPRGAARLGRHQAACFKPHTDFRGPTESGIVKMLVIGLGKHRQALEVHKHGVRGLKELIPACAAEVLRSGRIVLGVGIVESALHETSIVRAIPPGRLFEEEARLLDIARERMGRLAADEIDVLVVDEFGKDVSGTGMDTNVIGRMRIAGEPEPRSPRIGAIVLCDLTGESQGNALGMGLADFITQRVRDKIDFDSTAENVVTGTFIERGKMPLVAADPRAAFALAARLCRYREPGELRIMRVRSTLDIDVFYASPPLWDAIKGRPDIVQVAEGFAPAFDAAGELPPF
jgi:hypothetical protein